MTGNRKSVEFESVIDRDGNIRVPEHLRRVMDETPHAKMHVRLTAHLMNSTLRKKGVSEEEIERIGNLQLESRDQVVKFLLSEGALAGNRRIRARMRNKGSRH